jgi:hypothetical protein
MAPVDDDSDAWQSSEAQQICIRLDTPRNQRRGGRSRLMMMLRQANRVFGRTGMRRLVITAVGVIVFLAATAGPALAGSAWA